MQSNRQLSECLSKTIRKSVQSEHQMPVEQPLEQGELGSEADDQPEEDFNDQNLETIEFVEEGELIHMEINDGGAAAREFGLEGEQTKENQDSESDDDERGNDTETSVEGGPTSYCSGTDAEENRPSTSGEQAKSTQGQKRKSRDSPRVNKSKRQSVEKHLDNMSSTLEVMKDFFLNQMGKNQEKEERKREQKGKPQELINSPSETTIYHDAIPRESDQIETDDLEITFNFNKVDLSDGEGVKRDSTSSEERIDTSDEMMEIEGVDNLNDRFIADCEAEAKRRKSRDEATPREERRRTPGRPQLAVDRAESGTAKVHSLPGNLCADKIDISCLTHSPAGGMQTQSFVHQSSMVDENYMSIDSYLDDQIKHRIHRGDYVDFERLLPRSRNLGDEHKLELVYKGGQTFFVPAVDKEGGNVITNFHKWEQTFCVFSNVYARAHPSRATELIQYNHTIFTASSAYSWENVYAYDREFRHHMARFPNRNWALILQQAWTMILKDRVRSMDNKGQYQTNHVNKSNREACKCFNKGLCTAGRSCAYNHRCLECGKFGHGAHICRRRKNKSNGGGNTSENQRNNSSTSNNER